MIEPKPLNPSYNKGGIQIWEWVGVTPSDDIAPLSVNFTNACAQVVGGAVILEASLDGKNFGPVSRPVGEPTIIKTMGVFYVQGPVLFLRPKVLEGKATIRIAAVQ